MRLALLLAAVSLPAAAHAGPPIVAAATLDPATRSVAVELLVTNAEPVARSIAVAERIDADFSTADGIHRPVRLDRATGQPTTIALAASGYARLRYRLTLPDDTGPGLLALALPGAPVVALAAPASRFARAMPVPPASSVGAPQPAPRPAAEERGRSGFLANLSTYEPIYAVYGPGTSTDARIQISLKYQLFGTPGTRGSWADGILFGYTQQMFWDLGRASSPFRDVAYMPELYYALPKLADADGWSIGGRFGLRHQSNGRSGDASRSFNILYVEPEAQTRIGNAEVAIGPRAWIYVGRRSDNPDIARYRGHLGGFARIGTPTGLQLDLSGRIATTGRGAAEGLVSYPLTRLWYAGPHLYLIAQGFAGYGEDLLDYNRRQTRLRAGIGITR